MSGSGTIERQEFQAVNRQEFVGDVVSLFAKTRGYAGVPILSALTEHILETMVIDDDAWLEAQTENAERRIRLNHVKDALEQYLDEVNRVTPLGYMDASVLKDRGTPEAIQAYEALWDCSFGLFGIC